MGNFHIRLTIYLIIQISLLLPHYVISQNKIDHQMRVDLDNDGKKEQLLFYNNEEEIYEDSQFTTFCIVSKQDTFCVSNIDVWVKKHRLYHNGSQYYDDRFGIIRDRGKTYIWLTCFQYGCCLNTTTILEWTGDTLITLFESEFEVESILTVNNKKYISGHYSTSEVYGDYSQGFYFVSYFPVEYRCISDSMKVDSALTYASNKSEIEALEENIDLYNATVIQLMSTGGYFLISRGKEIDWSNRDFAMVSLRKLDKDHLNDYTKEELRLARNEIFAWYGYKFSSEDLLKHFKSKTWYKPTDISSKDIEKKLTEIEKHNIKLILQLEKSKS